jgi:hypothetical protein
VSTLRLHCYAVSHFLYRPGFIAGVTNPIFEQAGVWDVLCNIDTGKITVNKEVPWPQAPITFPSPPTATTRNGSAKMEGGALMSPDDESMRQGGPPGRKDSDFVAKSDNGDNVFMEEVRLLARFPMVK